jgi:hypothetical protein
MVPSPREVIVQRHLFAAFIRLAAIVPAVIGGVAWASWIIEGVMDWDFFWFDYYSLRIVSGLVLIPLAIALIIFARPLARLLIPIPVEGACPRCQFSTRGLVTPRCPECGLDLPADLLDARQPAAGPRAVSAPPTASPAASEMMQGPTAPPHTAPLPPLATSAQSPDAAARAPSRTSKSPAT